MTTALPTGYELVTESESELVPREPLQVVVTDVEWHAPHRIVMKLSDGSEQEFLGDHDNYEDIKRNLARSVDNGTDSR